MFVDGSEAELSAFGPAWGMVGTLLGLINMMRTMVGTDSAAIGAGMSLALITTLYGSVLAGENPRIITEKINSGD